MEKIKDINDIFLEYIKESLNSNRNYRGIIKTESFAIHFSYLSEIDDFFVSIETEEDFLTPICEIKKEGIVKAFNRKELLMFTDIDQIQSKLMNYRVDAFMKKYFNK